MHDYSSPAYLCLSNTSMHDFSPRSSHASVHCFVRTLTRDLRALRILDAPAPMQHIACKHLIVPQSHFLTFCQQSGNVLLAGLHSLLARQPWLLHKSSRRLSCRTLCRNDENSLVLRLIYTQNLSAQHLALGCLPVSHSTLHHHHHQHHRCRRQASLAPQNRSLAPDLPLPLEPCPQIKAWILSKAHRGGPKLRTRVQIEALRTGSKDRCLIRLQMRRLLALFNLVLKLRDRLHECCFGSGKLRQACLNIIPDGCVVTQVVLVGPIAG